MLSLCRLAAPSCQDVNLSGAAGVLVVGDLSVSQGVGCAGSLSGGECFGDRVVDLVVDECAQCGVGVVVQTFDDPLP